MIECAKKCCELSVSCPIQECRSWIDYEEDLNCINVAIKNHGTMKLREIAERLHLTPARVQQIEKSALARLKKLM